MTDNIPYGTNPYLDKMVDSDNDVDLIEIIKQHYGLDKLVHHKDPYIRAFVATQGYGLDILVDDPTNGVKAAVARQGYQLVKLFALKDSHICQEARYYCIDHGYRSLIDYANEHDITIDLDEYLHSDCKYMRFEAALYGYKLDELINDPEEDIRAYVADQGYGIDILRNDKSEYVRLVAKNYINNHTKGD